MAERESTIQSLPACTLSPCEVHFQHRSDITLPRTSPFQHYTFQNSYTVRYISPHHTLAATSHHTTPHHTTPHHTTPHHTIPYPHHYVSPHHTPHNTKPLICRSRHTMPYRPSISLHAYLCVSPLENCASMFVQKKPVVECKCKQGKCGSPKLNHSMISSTLREA